MSCGIDLVALAIFLPILLAQAGRATAGVRHGMKLKDLQEREHAAVKPRPVITREADVLTTSTFMNDGVIVKKVLTDYGCQVTGAGQTLAATVEGSSLTLTRTAQGNFEADITGEMTHERAEQVMSELQDMYLREVQSSAYNRVVKQADEKGYQLESEEIQTDNSIVLTYVVPTE
jgi:hypothetical protein